MYTDRDLAEINGRIRKNWMVLLPVLAVLVAAYVLALVVRVKWLALVAGAMIFVAACYGIIAWLWPNMRYRGFLRDMEAGLSRDITGTIVDVSDAAELHDGAWVLPVRVELFEEETAGREDMRSSTLADRLEAQAAQSTRNERIVYLNTSKREGFPEAGARVRLCCFGRHIKRVERLEP